MQIQAISLFSQRTKQTAQKSRTINRTTVHDVTNHVWGLVVSVAKTVGAACYDDGYCDLPLIITNLVQSRISPLNINKFWIIWTTFSPPLLIQYSIFPATHLKLRFCKIRVFCTHACRVCAIVCALCTDMLLRLNVTWTAIYFVMLYYRLYILLRTALSFTVICTQYLNCRGDAGRRVPPSRFRRPPIESLALNDQRKNSHPRLKDSTNFLRKMVANCGEDLFFWSSFNFGDGNTSFPLSFGKLVKAAKASPHAKFYNLSTACTVTALYFVLLPTSSC